MADSLKSRLLDTCLGLISRKIETLERAIADAQQAATDDTKSSAGDKFETSREMMKLEIDKYSIQLGQALDMKKLLSLIAPDYASPRIGPGSLVTTNEGLYFFSAALGKVMLENQPFFALSMASPIGIAFRNRQAGDEVVFMMRTIRIEKVE